MRGFGNQSDSIPEGREGVWRGLDAGSRPSYFGRSVCNAVQCRVDLQPSAARGYKLIGARVDAWAVDRCCASKPLEKVGERGPAKVMFSFCRKCPCEMSCDAIQTAIINRN